MLCLGTGGVVVVHLSCTLLFGPGSLSLFWSNEITQKYQRKTVPTERVRLGFSFDAVQEESPRLYMHAYKYAHSDESHHTVVGVFGSVSRTSWPDAKGKYNKKSDQAITN